ncbi:MAG: helix-turn-helix transcriptional regulator [Pseudomonadota bacterium]
METPQNRKSVIARQILAHNLRALRAERGWSQEDLALEAELHRTFVAHVERCVRNISIDNVEKLANALGVPVYRLLMP